MGGGYAVWTCPPGQVGLNSACLSADFVRRAQEVDIPKDRSCSASVAGNPVRTLTGRKTQTDLDFSTTGANGLEFKRSFSSPDVFSIKGGDRSALGMRWLSNFDARAFWVYWDFGRFNFQLPDGRHFQFQINSSGAQPLYFETAYMAWWIGNLGNGTKVEKFTDRIELTVDGDTTYVFDQSAKLTTIRFRGGYQQSITYDANGRRSVVSDNLGRTLTFSYDSHGYLSELNAVGTRIYKYRYKTTVDTAALEAQYPGTDFSQARNSRNVLEKVILPDDTAGTDADNPTLTYHYEDPADPTLLTGITDERGVRYATWAYDAQGRATLSTHAGGADSTTFTFDDTGNKVTIANALAKQTEYRFALAENSARRLTSIQGQASANCPSSTQSFTYDANSFVASVTDEEGRVTAYVNDARGRATSVTRGSGSATPSTTTMSWHPLWDVQTQIVEPGRTTDLAWNALGQLSSLTQTDTTTQTVPYSTNGQTRAWTFTYGTAGLLLTTDGPLPGPGDTVTYTYNPQGFVSTVTNEVGHVTTIDTVNERGQPTLVTDPNGIKTALTYDARGRLLTTTTDSTGNSAVTSFTYDGVGQITRITLPNGSWQNFTYDDGRRLTLVANNIGETITYVRDALGGATSITRKTSGGSATFSRTQVFDELGRLLRSLGASGSAWRFGYDKTDNVTAVTDPRSNIYGYAFDALNRLIKETDEDNHAVEVARNGVDAITSYKDGRNLTTSYIRNGFGEVIQAASPDSGTVVYQRDQRGLITQKTDARGIVTDYAFDNAGRLTSRSYPAATAENVTLTYDDVTAGNRGKGRLTGMADASGTTAWIYDARGNVLSETRSIAGKSYVIGYEYDTSEKVTRIVYPSGRIVAFGRDATGRVSGVTTRLNAGASPATLASGVTYQPFGDLRGLTFGNGLSLSRGFSADDELQQILVQDPVSGTALVKRSYGRGFDGLNLIQIDIQDDVLPSPSQAFTYTPTRRLQSGTGVWGQLNYLYDAVGNRTQETLVQGGVTTDAVTSYGTASNRLAQVTTNGSVTRTFGHDAAGNVTSDAKGGATWSFTHNAAGRLAQALDGTTLKGTYTYDGLERLAIRAVSNTTPSGTVHMLYDTAGRLLAEADAATGATLREYVWLEVEDYEVEGGPTRRPANDNLATGRLGTAENDNDPTARTQLPSLQWPKRNMAARALPLAVIADVSTSPQTLYVHADHLDRPIRMTDQSQTLVWDAQYRPYGEVISITGSASLDARFPGQWFQLETGLHYNWHRHYDPTTGRYLQPDPLGLVDGPSVYAYANSSPQMWSDPEGLNPAIPIVAYCAANPLACATLGGGISAGVQQIIAFCMAKKSGKEKASDIPSWAAGQRPRPGESGKEFADRLLDQRYGKGNYKKGPGSEHSKVQKYGDRSR
ncbi:RHS repeat-associated core domain-containing protein [Bosea sp. (in: a-proteobacteria)]